MTDINKARTVDLQIQDVFLEFAQSTKEDKYITAIAKIKALVVESLPSKDETTDDDLLHDWNEIGYRNGYNQCLSDVRSIWSDKE